MNVIWTAIDRPVAQSSDTPDRSPDAPVPELSARHRFNENALLPQRIAAPGPDSDRQSRVIVLSPAQYRPWANPSGACQLAQKDNPLRSVTNECAARDWRQPVRVYESGHRLLPTEPACSAAEAFALGLVTAAAFLGIAYSALCSVGLIQDWASFQFGIERLLH